MSEDSGKVKDVMPTYRGFLAGRLVEIWSAWDEGDLELSLRRACRLVTFLPRALKKQLREDRDKITKEMNSVYGLTGVDFYTTHLTRNRQVNRVAMLYLEPFADKILNLLDERGYLEKGFRVVPEGRELGY